MDKKLHHEYECKLNRDDRWQHRIIPRPRLRLDKEVEHVGNWISNWSGETIWQVEHAHSNIVSLWTLQKEHALVISGN